MFKRRYFKNTNKILNPCQWISLILQLMILAQRKFRARSLLLQKRKGRCLMYFHYMTHFSAKGHKPLIQGPKPLIQGPEPLIQGSESIYDSETWTYNPVTRTSNSWIWILNPGIKIPIQRHEPLLQEPESLIQGHEPLIQGSEFLIQGHEPLIQGSEFLIQGSESLIQKPEQPWIW